MEDSYQNPPIMQAATGGATPEPRRRQGSEAARLSFRTKLGFGMGHILNDLCASMWFTYLLLFFHKVLQFDNMHAGIVLFIGQIADGLATTFVGYFSDKGDGFWLCVKYGKRKSWHLLGTICILFSFPFVFMHSIDYTTTHESAKLVYYSAFVIIFQFGWAAVQISHLSMIPDITPCNHERTGLAAIRYGFTVVANITVYLVTWLFLGIANTDGMVGPDDDIAFRNIMLVSVCVGAFTSLLFHVLVRVEDNEENRLNSDGVSDFEVRRMGTCDWFREPQFYLVAAVYMSTRLFVNLSQAYIPLYLQISLKLNASYVAIIPLVMYASGLVNSSAMEFINRKIGRKTTFVLGCLVGLAGCVWIKVGCPLDSTFTGYEIYGIAALIGAGGSTMLITSLSLTSDLIGPNSESGAFVYGAMSLSDKISNGVAVVIIQVLFYVCGGAALLGALFMLTLVPFKLGERWRDKRNRRGDYEQLPGGVVEQNAVENSLPQRQRTTRSWVHRGDDDDETAPLVT